MDKPIKKDEKQQQAMQKKRQYRQPLPFTAQQKSEAVLSVWSERRKSSQVCREMGINWTILNQWQNRAMEGMLQALEPRVLLDKGPALSPRLQALLLRKQAAHSARSMSRRLKEVQEPKEQGTMPPTKE